MTIRSNPCKECQSIYHTAMYHKPKKPIKRTPIKRLSQEELLALVTSPQFLDRAAEKSMSKRQALIDRVKKKPRKKKTPRQKAKEAAWDAFSRYIRMRDCIRFTGDHEEGMCVTCKQMFPYKKLQAGHFVGGRGNAVLFNEQIVYSQCGYCNQKPPMGLGGNYAAYTLWMQDEGYTREQIEGFLNLRHETKVYKPHDFIELKELYEKKTNNLMGVYE